MPQCDRPPRGWYCRLDKDHDGPCPAWPKWWNIRWQLIMRGYNG